MRFTTKVFEHANIAIGGITVIIDPAQPTLPKYITETEIATEKCQKTVTDIETD